MGLGGYLTWTAAAREIRKKYGLRSLPMETPPPIIHKEQQLNGLIKIVNSEIFRQNPNFALSFDNLNEELVFPLVLGRHETNYVKEDYSTRVVHRTDKHIIHQICEFFGINDAELKCDLFFSDSQKNYVDKVTKPFGKFVTIEPHSKMDFTVNRKYPFEKWQAVVDFINKNTDYKVIQIGASGKSVLNDVIDFTGKTDFLGAAGVIGNSKLFLSTEGGLVHAATAVNTKSIVVVTSYQSLRMVAYPQNTNIYIGRHKPCGFKIECPECVGDTQVHNVDEIIESIKTELNE